MIVLIAWIAAVVVALIVMAALVVGLYGHVRRLARAAGEAERDVTTSLRVLSVAAARREGQPKAWTSAPRADMLSPG